MTRPNFIYSIGFAVGEIFLAFDCQPCGYKNIIDTFFDTILGPGPWDIFHFNGIALGLKGSPKNFKAKSLLGMLGIYKGRPWVRNGYQGFVCKGRKREKDHQAGEQKGEERKKDSVFHF